MSDPILPWRSRGVGLAVLVLLVLISGFWFKDGAYALEITGILLLCVFIYELLLGSELFTAELSQDKLNYLFRYAYRFTVFALVCTLLPFLLLTLPYFVEAKHYLEKSPVGILQGCTLKDENTAASSFQIDCQSQSQWVVNIGGEVREPAEGAFHQQFNKFIGQIMAENQRVASGEASLDAMRTQLASVSQALKDIRASLDLLATGSGSGLGDTTRLRETLADMIQTAQTDDRTDLNAAREKLSSIQFRTAAMAGAVQPSHAGYHISGGLVVPLFFVVLALMGAAVSMMRRVPEYQRRAEPDYQDKYEEIKKANPNAASPIRLPAAREFLVFQIMQVFSAPLIACVAYYLVNPEHRASSVALGFAAGFTSETILLMIRAATDKIKSGIQGAANGAAPPTNLTPPPTPPTPTPSGRKTTKAPPKKPTPPPTPKG